MTYKIQEISGSNSCYLHSLVHQNKTKQKQKPVNQETQSPKQTLLEFVSGHRFCFKFTEVTYLVIIN